MTVADVVAPLVHATLGDGVPVRLRCWDGSEFGPTDAPIRVHIATRRALRRIMWQPNELGFARAYVSGDLQIEGDLWAGLSALDEVAAPESGPAVTIDASTKRALARAVLRLGLIGPGLPRLGAKKQPIPGRYSTTSRDGVAHEAPLSTVWRAFQSALTLEPHASTRARLPMDAPLARQPTSSSSE